MEAKTNYSVVGFIVLILFGLFLSASLWLSVGFDQKSYVFYTVFFHEAVSGLSEDSPVKYNGVQVGFVKKISLNKYDPRQVEILLSIEKGTPVTTSTSATLLAQGITGVTYVGLSAGSSVLTEIQKMPGEPYPVIPSKPSLFNQFDSLLREVSDNVNKVTEDLRRILDERNAAYLRRTLANMANFSDQLPAFISKLDTTVHRFSHTAQDLSAASSAVSEAMAAGKQSMDTFSQQTLPPINLLLNRLNRIAVNVEDVSQSMRYNPSVLLRGMKPAKPGPGENQ